MIIKIAFICITLVLFISNIPNAAEVILSAPNIKEIEFFHGPIKLSVDNFYILPENKKVVFTSSFRIYVAELQSPQNTCLLVDQTVRDIRFSPDGRMIAYIQTKDDISVKLFISGVDGSRKKLLWTYKLPPRRKVVIKEWRANRREILVAERQDAIYYPFDEEVDLNEDIHIYNVSVDKGTVKREGYQCTR